MRHGKRQAVPQYPEPAKIEAGRLGDQRPVSTRYVVASVSESTHGNGQETSVKKVTNGVKRLRLSSPEHSLRSLPQPWGSLLPLMARILVWGLMLGLFYFLRSFFLLIFLTFVFAYIQNSSIQKISNLIKNRTLRVFIVAAAVLGTLIAVAVFLVPKVKSQTAFFVHQFSTYIQRADKEIIVLTEKYPLLKEVLPSNWKEEGVDGTKTGNGLKNSPIVSLLQQMAGFGEEGAVVAKVNEAIDMLGRLSGRIASVTSAFLLALLLSFLIVLDLPKLGASVAALEDTKLDFIYVEVAENISEFALVLGRALEAQFIIAVVNSLLTALGLTLLGLGANMAFLSVIVFFCSFIPVAGVFISFFPISLIALQTSGLQTMILAVVMICVIHIVEGYVLNPRIYGSYMRINPVIVLIILTIGGKLFHFWGLILGVPICTYVFGHAIRKREIKAPDDAVPPDAALTAPDRTAS